MKANGETAATICETLANKSNTPSTATWPRATATTERLVISPFRLCHHGGAGSLTQTRRCSAFADIGGEL